MSGREHVKLIRHRNCGRLRAWSRYEIGPRAVPRIDRLHEPRIGYSNMHKPGCRIEESRVRPASQRPLRKHRSLLRVELNEGLVVARGVQQFILVIDVEAVRSG